MLSQSLEAKQPWRNSNCLPSTSTPDGVLGRGLAGRLTTPYLVMIEAKRGIDAENPIFQLHGQLLCGAWKNWKQNQQDSQEIFGCYTIGQTWQFVRAEVGSIADELYKGGQDIRPQISIQYSQEYSEKTEAETIVKILKGIVERYTETESKQS